MSGSPPSSRGIGIRQATVALTDAQVKTLPTAGVTLVAAPAAGQVLIPVLAVARLAWVADYTNINAAAILSVASLGPTTLAPLNEADISGVSGLLAAGDTASALFTPNLIIPASATDTLGASNSGFGDSVLASALVLSADNAGGGNFTGGNAGNALRVTVAYYVLTLASGILS